MAESESEVFTKSEIEYASLWVMQFLIFNCQLVIRYHVTRAEAETCYGRFESWNKNTIRKVCLLRRSGIIQDRHCCMSVDSKGKYFYGWMDAHFGLWV